MNNCNNLYGNEPGPFSTQQSEKRIGIATRIDLARGLLDKIEYEKEASSAREESRFLLENKEMVELFPIQTDFSGGKIGRKGFFRLGRKGFLSYGEQREVAAPNDPTDVVPLKEASSAHHPQYPSFASAPDIPELIS